MRRVACWAVVAISCTGGHSATRDDAPGPSDARLVADGGPNGGPIDAPRVAVATAGPTVVERSAVMNCPCALVVPWVGNTSAPEPDSVTVTGCPGIA